MSNSLLCPASELDEDPLGNKSQSLGAGGVPLPPPKFNRFSSASMDIGEPSPELGSVGSVKVLSGSSPTGAIHPLKVKEISDPTPLADNTS